MRSKSFVLDNNIWISHFITRTEQKLIDIIANNKLRIFASDELYEEITKVLSYPRLQKYGVNISHALKTVKEATHYRKLAYPLKRYVPNDVNDDYLIALALQTNSGFITSGDDDILSQKEILEKKFKKLKILTKAEFEGMFG